MWYLRDADIRTEDLGPEDMEKGKQWIMDCFAEIDERMAQGELGFPPTPNRFCQYCAYVADCSAAEPADKVLKEKTDEELANECLTIEAKYKAIQDELKKRVKKNGPIEASGVCYDFYQNATGLVIKDVTGFHNALVENNKKPEKYLQGKTGDLRKLLATIKADNYRQFISEKPGNKNFKWKPVEEEEEKNESA
ncbi:MAG: PD-(D/E)XK nuclease family protein [Clostridiales bacterium]|nr:PD-(D/E)XK nuclease family protein [Clostridiales bacterium]MCF8023670.1 PD-(D/E)XK nuclease family protein [Clostridiales bacterium]